MLDLRGNGGGLLTEAVLTSSISSRTGRSSRPTAEPRDAGLRRGGDALRHPTVVLINGDTASAAEILTAALESGSRRSSATSFGKGTFQQVIPLDNGGALDLTVGEYLTPTGLDRRQGDRPR